LNQQCYPVNVARLTWLIPILLFLLALTHELTYLWVVPLWQGPDEPRHFEYVALVAGNISPTEPAPLELQSRIIASMIEHDFWDYGYYIEEYDPAHPPQTLDDIWPGFAHETHQPPLYYELAGAVVRLSGASDIDAQLLVTRLLSALLGAGVALLSYATARTLFPGRIALPLLVGLFVALLPMHAFINATANNDNLASFFVALGLYLCARLLRHGFRWREAILMIAATGLALATKRTGFIAPAILFVTLFIMVWDHLLRALRSRKGRQIAIGAALIIVATVAGCGLGWQFARSSIFSAWSDFFHLPPDVLELLFDGSYARALTDTPYPYYTRMVFESFWARFGWLNVRLPDIWYWPLGGISVVAGIGVLRRGYRIFRQETEFQAYQIRSLIVFVIVVLLALLLIMGKEVLFLSYQFGVVPQGRYLFPVIIPLATLLILGLRELTPTRWRPASAYVGGVAFAIFSMICIIGYVLPYYSP